MPQGITNAPSTFQRLMEKCVGDLHLNEVLVFLDDLIVFSETLEEHEARLVRVLECLKDYGLKLSPEKCHFFKSSVRYLGHVVDAQGVHTDPEKVSALKKLAMSHKQRGAGKVFGLCWLLSAFCRRLLQDSQALKCS